MFKKYEKVFRMEKEECEGILDGTVYLFEKVDGANVSVWVEEGQVCCGSRNRQVSHELDIFDDFRGFPLWVGQNVAIHELLWDYRHLRLYGEWLVKHTLNYPATAYNKLYVFDVYDDDEERFLSYLEYAPLLDEYGVAHIRPLAIIDYPTLDEVMEYVGKTQFDIEAGEGIVIKNYDFVNKFGDNVYGKLVRADFKEVNNLVFGAPKSLPVEVRIVGKYVTEARVRKVIQKAGACQIEDTAKVLGMVYHDLITEEAWEFVKEFKYPVINFRELRKKCEVATKNHFFHFLNTKGA